MESVNPAVDHRALALWRREKRWAWFTVLIPLQAVICLGLYLSGRMDVGSAALTFFALWVPTLLLYFMVRSLIWKGLPSLVELHSRNLAVALIVFLREGDKDSDSRQSFAEFDAMYPAFHAWKEEGFPDINPRVTPLLAVVADKFPTWLFIGPPPDRRVYPLIHTALLKADQREHAERLRGRFLKQFGVPLDEESAL